MGSRKPLDMLAVSLMGVLCLIWALQQIVLKAAASDVSPMLQIGLRSGIAVVLVALVMRYRGEGFNWRDGTMVPGVITGLLFSLEFLLLGEAIRFTSASHVVMFLYTAPVFASLAMHYFLPEERLRGTQWLGILLALSGLALTFFSRSQFAISAEVNSSKVFWGDCLALLGGVVWGIATAVMRCSSLARASSSKILIYHLSITFVLVSGFALLLDQANFNNSVLAWKSLLFQALVVSFGSFFGWLWLMKRYLASMLGAFSFLTPMFGIALGWLLLDEPIEASFLQGGVLVLLGVFLVTAHRFLCRQSK